LKPKTINSLMAYLRKNKGIAINGSIQKKKLRYMGYFNGYKGYRYCGSPSDKLPFKDFNEIQAVYDFDMALKAIMYPQIMFLETTLKNYALECTIDYCKNENFAHVFTNCLTEYKAHPIGSGKYNDAMTKRLKFREHVYNTISRNNKRSLVAHYYNKDKPVPIWSIFEMISFGEFGSFLECLNQEIRTDLSKAIGIKISDDSNGKMPVIIVFSLIDLRNAIAHNATIFDTRFKSSKISNRISAYIEKEAHIKNITFDSIVDYIILISFLLKILKCNKKDIMGFIADFEKACENLYKKVPANIYMKIVYSDTRNKLLLLKRYI